MSLNRLERLRKAEARSTIWDGGAAAAAFALALVCGDNPSEPSSAWRCDVTLTLVPATFGGLSSPSVTERGSGSGATEEAALQQALNTACGQLNLDSATAAL